MLPMDEDNYVIMESGETDSRENMEEVRLGETAIYACIEKVKPEENEGPPLPPSPVLSSNEDDYYSAEDDATPPPIPPLPFPRRCAGDKKTTPEQEAHGLQQESCGILGESREPSSPTSSLTMLNHVYSLLEKNDVDPQLPPLPRQEGADVVCESQREADTSAFCIQGESKELSSSMPDLTMINPIYDLLDINPLPPPVPKRFSDDTGLLSDPLAAEEKGEASSKPYNSEVFPQSRESDLNLFPASSYFAPGHSEVCVEKSSPPAFFSCTPPPLSPPLYPAPPPPPERSDLVDSAEVSFVVLFYGSW